jgi:hypothetical protein
MSLARSIAGVDSPAVMSQVSVRAMRFRSRVITLIRACAGVVRVTTVSRRHCENDPVFSPKPNRPNSFLR